MLLAQHLYLCSFMASLSRQRPGIACPAPDTGANVSSVGDSSREGLQRLGVCTHVMERVTQEEQEARERRGWLLGIFLTEDTGPLGALGRKSKAQGAGESCGAFHWASSR